eukprot:2176051-Rhodomonas_salina.2
MLRQGRRKYRTSRRRMLRYDLRQYRTSRRMLRKALWQYRTSRSIACAYLYLEQRVSSLSGLQHLVQKE